MKGLGEAGNLFLHLRGGWPRRCVGPLKRIAKSGKSLVLTTETERGEVRTVRCALIGDSIVYQEIRFRKWAISCDAYESKAEVLERPRATGGSTPWKN